MFISISTFKIISKAVSQSFGKKTKALPFLLCLLAFSVHAQKSVAPVKMTFGKGVTFASSDSLFMLSIGGRVQSMYEGKYDITTKAMHNDFLLRRCRLNFYGTAMDPKFSYRIQIGFAHGDITAANSSVQNNLILRDAMLYYQANDWLKIGFGQTKLPGNRQRQVSSANLQLVERSIANNNFTLDRDKGLWVNTKFKINKMVVKPILAISSGEGRIVSDKNGKLCYTGRIEFLPFGEFTNGGDYIESDQEREKKPKLSIAGAYSYNSATSRTMGQLGDYLYNSKSSNINYYGGDMIFKYKGFSFETEYYNRTSEKGVIINSKDSTQKNYAIAGNCLLIQSGIFITKHDELAVRYAQIVPDSKIAGTMNSQKEYVFGYSHYFSKHALKIQTDISYFINGSHETLVFRFSGVVTF